MRYVPGNDLKAVLRREKALEPARAVAIAGQLAGALDAAHRGGLVHRDVKPSNVLLDRQDDREHCYLADFGLTQSTSGATAADGQFMGSVDYVAPEQVRGDPVDGRADQYGLACLLFECLTGHRPVRAALGPRGHLRPPRGAAAQRERAPGGPAPRDRLRPGPRHGQGPGGALRELRRARDRGVGGARRGARSRHGARGWCRSSRRRCSRSPGSRPRFSWPGATAPHGHPLPARSCAWTPPPTRSPGGPRSAAIRGSSWSRPAASGWPTSAAASCGATSRAPAGSSASPRTASRATSPRSGTRCTWAPTAATSRASSSRYDAVTGVREDGIDLLACAMAGGQGVVWAAGCPFVQRLSTDGGRLRKLHEIYLPYPDPDQCRERARPVPRARDRRRLGLGPRGRARPAALAARRPQRRDPGHGRARVPAHLGGLLRREALDHRRAARPGGPGRSRRGAAARADPGGPRGERRGGRARRRCGS